MPRRNLYVLIVIAVAAFVCYQRADSANRTRYGRMFDTFAKVMTEIEQNYVKDVDRQALFHAGLQGVLGELDEYSQYIPPRHYTKLKESLDQQFGGIGIRVDLDETTKVLIVVSPLFGTPAYKAGIRAGDQILEVDGQSTEGFSIQQAVELMRGKEGDPVKLSVLHDGDQKPTQYEIVRAVIKVPSALGDRYNPDGTWSFRLEHAPHIGYVRINSFSEETASEMKSVMEDLKATGMQGLIVDLRNNPGGLLDSAVEFCDLFIDDGRIVSTRSRNGHDDRTYDAHANGGFEGFPMAILVNGFSASASEIVAACLQDHGRAVVVGQRSFGKGSVQNVIPLEGGNSALKLTVASYWRPSGKNIHRFKDDDEDAVWGVFPNVGFEVKLEGDELDKATDHRLERDVLRPAPKETDPVEAPDADEGPYVDPQLQRAIDYIQDKLGKTPQEQKAA